MDYYKLIMETLRNNEVKVYIKEDVLKRCYDWFSMNGKETDNYIKRQYEYLISNINK